MFSVQKSAFLRDASQIFQDHPKRVKECTVSGVIFFTNFAFGGVRKSQSYRRKSLKRGCPKWVVFCCESGVEKTATYIREKTSPFLALQNATAPQSVSMTCCVLFVCCVMWWRWWFSPLVSGQFGPCSRSLLLVVYW